MTALAAEIMAILKGNDGLRADSLVSVLNAIEPSSEDGLRDPIC